MFNLSLAFKMKTFSLLTEVITKAMTQKLCQIANFENEGTTTQIGTLYVLLNSCQYLYCLEYMIRLVISRCKKISNVILRFKEN